jgi:aspartate racemase
MKTIGLIGGMSWESSAVYYNIINRKTNELLGGYHCAKSIMVTVDFAKIQELQFSEDWKSLEEMMIQSAKQLEAAGADFVILCTNTMHLCSPAIVEDISKSGADGYEIHHGKGFLQNLHFQQIWYRSYHPGQK